MQTAKLKARTIIGWLAVGAVMWWGAFSGLRGGSNSPVSVEPSRGGGAELDEAVRSPVSETSSRRPELAAAAASSSPQWPFDEIDPDSRVEVRLLVVDTAQRPIEGAVANTQDISVWPFPESNADGIVTIALERPRPERLQVKAYGFQETSVDLSLDAGQPRFVVLEPCNRLRLRIVTDSPEWTDQLTLIMRSMGDPFRSVSKYLGFYDAGAKPRTWAIPEGKARVTFEVGPEGVVDLEGLAVGVDIEVAVADCRGRVLHSERLPDRTELSNQEVVINVPGAQHSWSGRVVDESGSAVVGAEVRVTWNQVEDLPEPVCEPTQTDADGNFRVDGLWSERGDLIVIPAEHSRKSSVRKKASTTPTLRVAEQRWPNVDLSAPGTFTISNGRTFTVFVREEAGKALSGADLAVFDEGERTVRVEKSSEGRYVVHGAPVADCVIRLGVGGRIHERTVAASQDELVITVPVHGLVEISIAGDTSVRLRNRNVLFESDLPELSRESLRIRDHGWKEIWSVPIFRALPGVYEARIVGDPQDVSWSVGGGSTLLSAIVPVRVVAGEKVQVLLTPNGK